MWGQTLWNGNEADHCFVISPRLLDLQLVFPDWIPRPDRDKMGQKQTTANAPRGLVIQAHIVCCEKLLSPEFPSHHAAVIDSLRVYFRPFDHFR